MVLTEAIKSKFETVLTLEAQKKQLETTIKEAKAEIQKYMYDNGELAIKQDGYIATISEGLRKTLLAEEVEKLLGKPIPTSCYKETPYTSFTVKRMKMV